MTLATYLPKSIKKRLFGDREKWGLIPIEDDACWQQWEKEMPIIYEKTQQQGVGRIVNHSGYQVMSNLDLTDKVVAEFGPGNLPHLPYWKSTPNTYWLIDRREEFLTTAKNQLMQKNIKAKTVLANGKILTPTIENESIDILCSFYSLEHLYPLEDYLQSMLSLLKPGGYLVGAIPAEGGLAWGLGRYLTSRRWFLKHTSIDPDKVICWEHPTMADEIIKALNRQLKLIAVNYWPLKIPLIDTNLTIRFVYQRP